VGTSSAVFDLEVVGDPAAGVQGVYITWTDGNGVWQTLPLTQNSLDTIRWRGELPLAGVNRAGFAYIVQAVSGVGLVAVDDNGGQYYGLGDGSQPEEDPTLTTLTLDAPPTSATVGDSLTFGATLKAGEPLADQVVTFQFGELTRTAVTGTDGRAQVMVRLDLLPSSYALGATYNGAAGFAASTARATIATTVARLVTTLSPSATTVNMIVGANSGVAVTLRDSLGRSLLGAPVFFVISGAGVPGGAISVVARTDWAGVARLGVLSLSVGTYTVRAFFGDSVPAPVGQTFEEPFYDPAPPATITVNVTSAWQFAGFFSPVDNLPVLNSVNAGRAIPIRFSLGGNRGLDIFEPGYPASQPIACSTGVPMDTIEETVSAAGSSLQNDATSGRYTYVWKTNATWANSCRQLVITFLDGTTHRANFVFKR
jgi:hypothetical protein